MIVNIVAVLSLVLALGLVVAFLFLPHRLRVLLKELLGDVTLRLEDLKAEQRKVVSTVQQELSVSRQESAAQSKLTREELSASLKNVTDSIAIQFGEILKAQNTQLDAVTRQLAVNTDAANQNFRSNREEISKSLKSLSEALSLQMTQASVSLKTQLESFSQQLTVLSNGNEQRLEKMRQTVEARLDLLRNENNEKLEQMRSTVDEKLHTTLEKRLGDSFKLVSDRLDKVHAGLGEMQRLASDVGNLKHVLTNIKMRGTWGEVQLGALLEQVLSPEQYEKNVAPKRRSSETVEYAIKLPGRESKDDIPVWLPIDSKFPQEDYQRLLSAQETANPDLVEDASKSLERAIQEAAKTICAKYIDPPNTTDFAIMFLPTEGLYAEVLRRNGICELLQRKFRVVVTSPTTLGALLNSLQMGFRTLAIEKRSSEVWKLLAAVKTEFGNFGTILEKTQKKLEDASSEIEKAASKSRTIVKKLRKVQEIPSSEAEQLFAASDEAEMVDAKPEVSENGDQSPPLFVSAGAASSDDEVPF